MRPFPLAPWIRRTDGSGARAFHWLPTPTPRPKLGLQACDSKFRGRNLGGRHTDGNGRLGRLVAVLQLLNDGALKTPVLSISDWLKDRGPEYRDHLLRVSVTGEWAPWIEFFAQTVAASADDAHRRVMGLLALREELSEQARRALPRARLAIEIAEDLIAFPILTVAAAQSRYGKSNQANRNAINRLCELGLLEPYGDTRYDRLYWNRRVFEVIEG